MCGGCVLLCSEFLNYLRISVVYLRELRRVYWCNSFSVHKSFAHKAHNSTTYFISECIFLTRIHHTHAHCVPVLVYTDNNRLYLIWYVLLDSRFAFFVAPAPLLWSAFRYFIEYVGANRNLLFPEIVFTIPQIHMRLSCTSLGEYVRQCVRYRLSFDRSTIFSGYLHGTHRALCTRSGGTRELVDVCRHRRL